LVGLACGPLEPKNLGGKDQNECLENLGPKNLGRKRGGLRKGPTLWGGRLGVPGILV